MTFQALGVAILLTLTPGEIQSVLPPEVSHDCKQRSVVLIDEIDKAPRDFANDLLNELEQDMYFRIPELGNRMIRADQDLKPIVIITSNSEKDLPDAFLRRCIYYDIPFPESERLGEIVANRLSLPGGYGNSLVQMALDLFYRLRSPQSGLRKKPATAELLGWLLTLQAIYPNLENPLAMANLQVIYQTLSSLIKTAEDQQLAVKVVDQWIQEQNQKPN
jgi:MoxR-like ATPase